jgi:CelD/BcsL family acetyltransferase involved in cellulose biosynthesis
MEIRRVAQGELAAFLDELARLHLSRWESRGEPGLFADERVLAFHREAAPALQCAGFVRCFLATMEGRAVAALYALEHAGRLMLYASGFDPAYAYESPGQLLLAHAIESALRDDIREIHFLRGREAYKYDWNPVDRINIKRSFVKEPARA